MKQILTISLAIAIAIPLFAQEAAKSTKGDETSTTAKADDSKSATEADASKVESAAEPVPVSPNDSPLVAAAKRANRLGKHPKNVITNETLAKMGGNAHVSEGSGDPHIPVPIPPPSPTPEMQARSKAEAAQKKKDEVNAEKKAQQEEAARKASLLNQAVEQGYAEGNSDADAYTGETEDDLPPPPPPNPQQ